MSINSVCTIEDLNNSNLIVEVMPNTFNNKGLQFYYLNGLKNNLQYTNFGEFNQKLKESLRNNKTFYITFCGINNKDRNIPDYLYLVFSGCDVEYQGYENNCNKVFLEFKFNIKGKSLEKQINELFTNNVGVFIQAYL